jgi:RNA polymerase sigma-70 factor (ECF subfamily)
MIKPPIRNQHPEKIQDNDFKLIEAINAGQKDLFYDIVKKYERPLYNFGLRMCKDPQDAEDVVQDTFLNVYRYLRNFRYETKFKNWLYRIAASTCYKKKRRSKYAPDREISLEEFIPRDEKDVPAEIPDWASIPLDRLLNEELSTTIKEAIYSLPEKYRVVIVLRDMEGFTTEETSQILEISASNVKVRLHRARLFLREKLKDYFEHEQNTPSS